MDSYTSRTSCRDREEYYLDKLQKIFSAPPVLGTPPHPSRVTTGVFVGSTADAENVDQLRRHGISHVVYCSTRRKPLYRKGNPYYDVSATTGKRAYLRVDADDEDDYDVTIHFNLVARWIWTVRKTGGQVLICSDGPNLSGAICLGYMLERGTFLLEAARLLKNARRVALCNTHFMRLIVRHARQHALLDPEPEEMTITSYGTARDRYRLITAHLPEVRLVTH